MQRLAAACIGICVAFAGGCNQRVAVLDTPAAPTAPPAATPPQPGVASIDVQPPAVNGGDGATGMVTLTGPALPPGVTVSLSSSDDAAVIAPEVMVPPGSTFARFAVNSRRLPVDRAATITGSTAASTAATRFEVWTIEAPIYFNFFSDDGDAIGRGDFGRFVPGTSAFAAVCDRNEVRILITAPGPEFWSATFRAPGDEPLAQRFYDNALRAGFNGVDPGVQIAGRSRACNSLRGRFSVEELDVRNNRVNAFRAVFKQQCDGRDGAIRGEVRVVNMPPSTSVVNCFR